MRSSSSKVTFFFLVLPLGLFTAGCGGMGVGAAGVHDVIAGNWDRARIDFTRDYQDKPEHPIAVFNMGVTHQHDGNIGKADTLFSEAAVRGKGYVPDGTLEPPEVPARRWPNMLARACIGITGLMPVVAIKSLSRLRSPRRHP